MPGLALLAAVLAGQAQALTVNGDITSATTWGSADSPVLVEGDVRVLKEATLTIQAGVEVRFSPGASLGAGELGRFGDNRDRGAIVAAGTEIAPVKFTSNIGNQDWDGLLVDQRRGDGPSSSFTRATIEKSSGVGLRLFAPHGTQLTDVTVRESKSHGIEASDGGSLTMTRGSLADNSGYGLFAPATMVSLTDVTIARSSQRPLRAPLGASLQGLVLDGNAIKDIELGGGLTSSRTLARLTDASGGALYTYTYVQSGTIWNEATLTVAPGVTLRLSPGVQLVVGTCCYNDPRDTGAISAVGTAALPITITSSSGLSAGLYFQGSSTYGELSSRLEHVTLEKAQTLIHLQAHESLAIANSVLRDSGTNSCVLGDNWNPRGCLLSATSSRVNVADSTLTRSASGHTAVGLISSSGVFERTTISLAGSHAMELRSASPTLRSVTIVDHAAYGIVGDGGAWPVFDGVRIVRGGQRPLQLLAVPSMATGVTFEGNGIREIELHGTDITSPTTLAAHRDAASNAAIPYRVLGRLRILSTSLTLDPGAELRFQSGAYLSVGCNEWQCYQHGTLVAVGTAAQPIRLTTPGGGREWAGIDFMTCCWAQGPSRFANVTIEHSWDYGILLRQSIEIRDTTVRNSRYAAIYMDSGASPRLINVTLDGVDNSALQVYGYARPLMRDSTIRNAGDYGIITDSVSVATLERVTIENTGVPAYVSFGTNLDGVTFRNNRNAFIYFSGGMARQDVTYRPYRDTVTGAEHTYYMWTCSSIGDGATVTLDPGVRLRVSGDRWSDLRLWVGRECGRDNALRGALVAKGTEERPIILESVSRGGRWNGLWFDGRAEPEMASVLEHVVVRQSGSDGVSLEELNSFTLRDSVLEFHSGSGMRLSGSSPTIENNDIRLNSGTGLAVYRFRRCDSWRCESSASSPVVANNRFTDNGGYGIDVEGWPSRDAPASQRSSVPVLRNNVIQGNGAAVRASVLSDVSSNTYRNNSALSVELWGETLRSDLRLGQLLDVGSGLGMRYNLMGHGDPAMAQDIIVPGGRKLTLDAGVRMLFGANTGLRVHGSLDIAGTQLRPVTLTSASGAQDWEAVSFPWASGASTLRNVTIARSMGRGVDVYGGAPLLLENLRIEDSRGDGLGLTSTGNAVRVIGSSILRSNGNGVTAASSSPLVERTLLSRNAGAGFAADGGSFPSLRGVTIERSGQRPLHLPVMGVPGQDVTLERNGIQEVLLLGDVTRDTRLPQFQDSAGNAVPYRTQNSVNVVNGATLTINPGVTILFEPRGDRFCMRTGWWGNCEQWGYVANRLQVGRPGSFLDTGALVTLGTAEQPVVFISSTGQRGWNGVVIDGSADKPMKSQLQGLVIEKATVLPDGFADGSGLLIVNHDQVELEDITVRDNAGHGLALRNSPVAASRITAVDNSGNGVWFDNSRGSIAGGLARNNTFDGVGASTGGATSLRLADMTLEENGNRVPGKAGVAISGPVSLTLSGVRFGGAGRDLALHAGAPPVSLEGVVFRDSPVSGSIASAPAGGVPNLVTVPSWALRTSTVEANGGSGAKLDFSLGTVHALANYTYLVRAADGTPTQSDLLRSTAEGSVAFTMILAGNRTATLTVVPEVFMDFRTEPDRPYDIDTVWFRDASVVRYADVLAFFWDLGDGTTSKVREPSHKYADDMLVEPLFRITLDTGAKFETSRFVEILNVPPVADFKFAPVKPTFLDKIQFTDLSTDADPVDPENPIVAWFWDFGDGGASTEQNPTHTYPEPRMESVFYNVTLTVTDDDGAGVTLVRPLKVWALPEWVVDRGQEEVAAKQREAGVFLNETQARVKGAVDQLLRDGAVLPQEVRDRVAAAHSEFVFVAQSLRARIADIVAERGLDHRALLCLDAALAKLLDEEALSPLADCALGELGRSSEVADRQLARVVEFLREEPGDLAATALQLLGVKAPPPPPLPTLPSGTPPLPAAPQPPPVPAVPAVPSGPPEVPSVGVPAVPEPPSPTVPEPPPLPSAPEPPPLPTAPPPPPLPTAPSLYPTCRLLLSDFVCAALPN